MDRIRFSRRPQRRKSEMDSVSILNLSKPTSRRKSRQTHSKLNVVVPILLLSTPILAQGTYTILDASILPSCALQCQQLIDAQKVCVPPTAPASNPATYTSCFCSSNYFANNLKVGQSAGLCQGLCTPADMGRVQAWFNGICANPGASGGSTTSTGGGPTVTLGPTQNKQNKAPVSPKPQSWIHQNYRWVIMAIILVIAAIAAIVFGTWYKRRRRAKKSANTLRTQDISNALRDPHPIAPPMTPTLGGNGSSKGVLSPVSNLSTANIPPGRGTPVSTVGSTHPPVRRIGSGGSAGLRSPPPVPPHGQRPQMTQMSSAPSNSSMNSIYTRASARSPGPGPPRPIRGAQRSMSGDGDQSLPLDVLKGKGRVAELAVDDMESYRASPMPSTPEEWKKEIDVEDRPATAPTSRTRFDANDPNRPTVAGYANFPSRADSVSPGTIPSKTSKEI